MSGYIYNNNIKFKSYGIFMVHAAGFLAGKIMRGGGFGVIINLYSDYSELQLPVLSAV